MRLSQLGTLSSRLQKWALVSISIGAIGACGGSHTFGEPDANPSAHDSALESTEIGTDAPDPERCNGIDDDNDGKRDEGCPIRITEHSHDDVSPQLKAGRVVWLRLDPLFGLSAGQLMMRSLPDGPEELLVEETTSFSYDGQYVAYREQNGYQVMELASRDIVAQIDPQLGRAYRVDLNDGVLTWTERVDGTEEDEEIFAMRIGESATRITNHPAIQFGSQTEAGQVVFLDDRHGHHTHFLLHFFEFFAAPADGSSVPRRITTRPDAWAKSRDFLLNQGRILVNEIHEPWEMSFRPKACTTALYQLSDGSRAELFSEELPCYIPTDLRGERAVFELDPDGNSDIVVMDLPTGELHQITYYNRHSNSGRIESDLVVWSDDRNDQWDLYMMDLSDLADGDFFPEGRPR